MPDSLFEIAGPDEVTGRPPVNRHNAVGHLDFQPCLQKIPQQGVIAIAGRLARHRHQKKLPAGELINQSCGLAGLQNFIAKLGVDGVQQGTLHEQGARRIRQPLEHRMPKIIHDFRLAGVKVLQGLHPRPNPRQQGNFHPGHPAFGNRHQVIQGLLFQGLAAQPLIQFAHITAPHLQVDGADLQHLVVQPQPANVKQWLGAAGNDQVHILRRVRQQGSDHAECFFALDMLKIVEHDKQRQRHLLQGVIQ